MSEEREVAVLASVVFVLVVGAVGLALIDAGTFPRAALVFVLAAMSLVLLLVPSFLTEALRRRRDRARLQRKEISMVRLKRIVAGLLAAGGVGALVYIVFFAQGV